MQGELQANKKCSAVFANLIRFDAQKCIRRKRRKGVKSLISQYVSISQKENAGPAPAITVEVPSALKKLPDNLESNKGFPCPSGESKQNALLLLCYCVKCLVNSQLLIVAHTFCASNILKRYLVKVLFPKDRGWTCYIFVDSVRSHIFNQKEI